MKNARKRGMFSVGYPLIWPSLSPLITSDDEKFFGKNYEWNMGNGGGVSPKYPSTTTVSGQAQISFIK